MDTSSGLGYILAAALPWLWTRLYEMVEANYVQKIDWYPTEMGGISRALEEE
jgi:hypothetical protein